MGGFGSSYSSSYSSRSFSIEIVTSIYEALSDFEVSRLTRMGLRWWSLALHYVD